MLIYVIVILGVGVLIWQYRERKRGRARGGEREGERYPRRVLYGKPVTFQEPMVRDFPIKGTYHRHLPATKAGSFTGRAVSEKNPYDEYAVAIYDETNTLLGYVPKKNRRLSDSLCAWNEGDAHCYGNLRYDDYSGRWEGRVYIYVGFQDDEIATVQTITDLQEQIKAITDQPDPSIDDRFNALRLNAKRKKLAAQTKVPLKGKYRFPRRVLPALARELEKEKRWEELTRLLDFEDEIENNLAPSHANVLLRRIEHAQTALGRDATES